MGLLQRFGICALSQDERGKLECVCTNNPSVLKACVGKLVEMQVHCCTVLIDAVIG